MRKLFLFVALGLAVCLIPNAIHAEGYETCALADASPVDEALLVPFCDTGDLIDNTDDNGLRGQDVWYAVEITTVPGTLDICYKSQISSVGGYDTYLYLDSDCAGTNIATSDDYGSACGETCCPEAQYGGSSTRRSGISTVITTAGRYYVCLDTYSATSITTDGLHCIQIEYTPAGGPPVPEVAPVCHSFEGSMDGWTSCLTSYNPWETSTSTSWAPEMPCDGSEFMYHAADSTYGYTHHLTYRQFDISACNTVSEDVVLEYCYYLENAWGSDTTQMYVWMACGTPADFCDETNYTQVAMYENVDTVNPMFGTASHNLRTILGECPICDTSDIVTIAFSYYQSWGYDVGFDNVCVTCGDPCPTATEDYGDAPDSYLTLAASGGASHTISGGYLGTVAPDADLDGIPSVLADGDDLNNTDDEDGVTFAPAGPYHLSDTITANVVTSGPGYLSVWADLDCNGVFDPADQILTNTAVDGSVTPYALPFTPTAQGSCYLRFRFTDADHTGLGAGGPAASGEVEDYIVNITPENDLCGDAVIQTLTDGVPVTVSGNNTGATDDCSDLAGLSVAWEAFEIPVGATYGADVTLDFCDTVDTWNNSLLYLFPCPCDTTATAYTTYDVTTCANGNLTIYYADLMPGTYYFPVLLDEANGSIGPYTLNFTATYNLPPECLTPWTDSDTYYDAENSANGNITYSWVDPTGFANVVNDPVDDGEFNIDLTASGLSADFYGTAYTDIRVGTNGAILVGVTTGDVGISNDDLVTHTQPMVACFWDDMNGSTTENIYWDVLGTAPNRQLVISYSVIRYGNGLLEYQIIYNENDMSWWLQYADTVCDNATYDHGRSASTGISMGDGTVGITYIDDPGAGTTYLCDGMAIRFLHTAPVNPANPTCDPAPGAICEGESADVSATASGTDLVHWYASGTTPTPGDTPLFEGNTYNVSPAATTTYTAWAYNGSLYSLAGCDVTVTVNPVPDCTISAASQVLFSTEFSVSVPDAGVSAIYTWNVTGDGTITSTTPYGNTITIMAGATVGNTITIDCDVETALGCTCDGTPVNVDVVGVQQIPATGPMGLGLLLLAIGGLMSLRKRK